MTGRLNTSDACYVPSADQAVALSLLTYTKEVIYFKIAFHDFQDNFYIAKHFQDERYLGLRNNDLLYIPCMLIDLGILEIETLFSIFNAYY